MIVLTLHRDTPLSRAEIAALPAGCYPVMSTDDVIARAELELPPAHVARFAVEMIRAIPDADLEAEERPSAEAAALLRAGALTDPFRTWMPALLRQRLPTAATLSTMPVTPILDPGLLREPEEPPAPEVPSPVELPPAEAPPAEAPPAEAPPAEAGIPTRAVPAPSLPPELASFMDTLLSAPPVRTGPPSAAAPPAAAPPPVLPAAPSERPDPWELLASGKIEAAEAAFKGHTLDADGREKVRELLSSDQPAQVAQGCRICRLTRWKASSAMIARVLYRNEALVRMEAVRAMGVLAGPGMEPALHMLLRDSEPDVRRAAQRSINQIQRRGG